MNIRIKLPIKEICKKYQDGISAIKLAEEYGCSVCVIIDRLRDNNVEIRARSPYIILPVEKIVMEYQNKMSIEDLSNKYNCSITTIIRRLQEFGIVSQHKNYQIYQ